MRIQIASDLHLEFLESRFPDYRIVEAANADLLVIAGDIHHGTKAIHLFADWPVPVVYVHGNHEIYGDEPVNLVDKIRAASHKSNVHYLENEEYVFNGVRFLGCCLWTDYALYPGKRDEAMAECEAKLADHRAIRTAHGHFATEDALALHEASRAWLDRKLDESFDGRTVVITHHAPHSGSIHSRYAGMAMNAGFVSDLTPLIEKADLWIHGHVHDSFDYRVGKSRVVANPRGYARNYLVAEMPERIRWENERFDPRLTVEI